MSARKLSNKELIKKVATDVEDPILRKQLIEALLERDETNHRIWNNQPHMAVHPEAIPSNVRIKKWVNAIGGIVFFIIVYSHYKDTPESATSHSFLWLMTYFMPIVFLINHIQLSNITKWHRRGGKPPRKWFGLKKLFR